VLRLDCSGATLEVLNSAFVGLGLFARGESSKVVALARLGVPFLRVKAVFARWQLSNHRDLHPYGL